MFVVLCVSRAGEGREGWDGMGWVGLGGDGRGRVGLSLEWADRENEVAE